MLSSQRSTDLTLIKLILDKRPDVNMAYQIQPGSGKTLRAIYRCGEYVGQESRHLEFKIGHMFMGNLHKNVTKYMCGFANSKVDGKLLIGVKDDGTVSGYRLSHSDKDNICKKIDSAMAAIIPQIFPEHYGTRFVPVIDDNDRYIEGLFVMEISIQGSKLCPDLYSCSDGAFLRQDVSTYKMSVQEVKDWVKKQSTDTHLANNLKEENEEVKHENLRLRLEKERLEAQVKEMTEREQENNRKREEDVHQKLDALQNLLKQNQTKKSKMCIIM